MQLKQSFQYSLLFFCSLLVCINTAWSNPDNRHIQYADAPSWVKSYSNDYHSDAPLNDIEDGVYYRVLESQIRYIAPHSYESYARRAIDVISVQGMEYSSSFNIDFDPSYQSVVLHDIKVIRDGKEIDKKETIRASVIQREERMEALIYDGTLTANIILDDIRVGDIVEYSYSTIGRNPVYGEAFSLGRQASFSVPIQQLNIRLLVDKKTPVQHDVVNTSLIVEEKALGEYREYSVRGSNIQPVYYEANAPRWFDPYGKIYFSSYTHWNQVSNWALPLYDNVIAVNREVQEIADSIKLTHTSSADKISAALLFVQNEIRYLGIENGLNSHKPSSTLDTLQRRYGDCKDKAVLFISILKALNIQASPALVNTEVGPVLNTLLPSSNVFDHVIVKVQDGSQSYWLDPTNRYQRGSVNDISEARFGFALVLNKDTSTLENMNKKEVKSSGIIRETFDLTAGTAEAARYSVKTQYKGQLAENMRYDLAVEGISGTQQKYNDYYKKYYSKITMVEPLKRIDSDQGITIEERYSIPEFWRKSEQQQGALGDFYADHISFALTRDDGDERYSPYYLSDKRKITHIIEVALPDEGWNLENEHVVKKNKIFDFEYEAAFDRLTSTLLLTFQLDLKEEFVASIDYPEYLKNRDEINDLLSYSIIKYYDTNSITSEQTNWSERLILFFAGYLLVTFILFISIWIYGRNKKPEDDGVLFYPVSLDRFYIYSVLTFNLYIVYWCYRNWLYIKNEVNSSIMPVGRAFFNTIWFYSLNNYFKDDSEQRYGKNKLYSKFLAACLLIIYILLSLAQGGSYYVFSLLAIPLLFVVYVRYIYSINRKDSKLFQYNTQWNWKQIPLILFFTPLFLVAVLGGLYLIPSSDIEKGDRIWSHDLRFMQRESILTASENIQYFYSNDFWSVRTDGNGFTEEQVFSYWNESDKLSIEKARYEEIKDIDTQYGDTYFDTTVVTITRHDDSTFMLFLSGDKVKDKMFIRKMTKYWQEAQNKEVIL